MKKLIIILLVLISFAHKAHCDNKSIIDSANQAYNKKKYVEAIALYKKVIDNGYEAADIYYNIGNSYFRIANFPYAILYYEKAKKLNPADADIDFNLKIANTKIIDKLEVVPQLFFVKWWNAFSNLFSIDNWAIASIICISLFILFLLIYIVSNSYNIKKISFWLFIIMLFLSITSYGFARKQYTHIISQTEGIILTPTVTVRSSPDEKGTDKFVIHEGTKVVIEDELNNWVKVRIANGSNGWVEKQTYELI